MKIRHKDGILQVDFNERGWNPEEVCEMDEKQFHIFIKLCKSDYEDMNYMEFGNMIDVIIQMVKNGDL